MILFFGTRPGKKVQRRLVGVPCDYCKQTYTLEFVEQASYFHLFWIKLFKIQTKRYAECSHCKRVYYEQEFSREMQKVTKP